MLPDIIIGSVSTTDLINWGKNIDGHGIFDPFKIVGPGETLNISVSDLDGDNDLDVLTAFRFEDQFVWYENLDGQGNFSAKKIIDNENRKIANSIFNHETLIAAKTTFEIRLTEALKKPEDAELVKA